jgi:hypothetical protein
LNHKIYVNNFLTIVEIVFLQQFHLIVQLLNPLLFPLMQFSWRTCFCNNFSNYSFNFCFT